VDAVLREQIRDEVRSEVDRIYHRAYVKAMSRTCWVLMAVCPVVIVAVDR